MKDSQLLESKGWRKFATKKTSVGVINCWDHPDHQNMHGYFTTTQATTHQKYVEKVGHCTCIPRKESR